MRMKRSFKAITVLVAGLFTSPFSIAAGSVSADPHAGHDMSSMQMPVPANLERLFDRFYRADSSRVHNTEGAGLGLSITRSIIHAHGGELSAEQQGREIVFKVRLLMD